MNKWMVVLATVAFAALQVSIASAADLAVPAPPPIAAPTPTHTAQMNCAWVEATIANWGDRPAVFRITAEGGEIPNGRLEMPAKWNPETGRMCIPRELFVADVVQVCIGNSSIDHSNSKLIRGHWMVTARENLSRGNVVNPGQPMMFRYNGPTRPVYEASRRGVPAMAIGIGPLRLQFPIGKPRCRVVRSPYGLRKVC